MPWLVGRKACGILALQLGIKPAPLALEGGILITGPRGKSVTTFLNLHICTHSQKSCPPPIPVRTISSLIADTGVNA